MIVFILGRHRGLKVRVLDSGSRSLCSNPGQGTALCSWARHFPSIVPLFTKVYKWPMGTSEFNAGEGADPAMA